MSAKERPIISTLINVAMWFERRLHLVKVWKATGGHPIPKSSASWFYVFGSMTLLCFTIQILTGILLALVYIPSASEAYRSLEFLNYQQELGWFLRAVHYWGSNCMVVVMFFHMTQVFLWGAYKHPRELTWISGVVLLLLTLGLSFTGQVMRFDSDAYWGIGIGAAISGRIPFVGAQVVNLLLGGPIIGSDTLSRFFALHVFVLPGAVLALVSLHLRLVLLKGINEYPKPGVQVRKETYVKEYEEMVHKDGMPFVPNGIGKDIVANGLLLLVIVALAVFVGPKGPEIPADPAQIISEAKPDYPFLWLLSAAALLPNGSEIILFFVVPDDRDDPLVWVAFLFQPRGETLQPAADFCHRRHAHLPGDRDADLRRDHRPMVTAHGGLERHSDEAGVHQRAIPGRTARRSPGSEQTMSQLSRHRSRRRSSWTGSVRCRKPHERT